MIIKENEASLFGFFESKLERINKAKLTQTNSISRQSTENIFQDKYHFAFFWSMYDIIMSKKWSTAQASLFMKNEIYNTPTKINGSALINDIFADSYKGYKPYTALNDLEETMKSQTDPALVITASSESSGTSTYKVPLTVTLDDTSVITKAVAAQDAITSVKTNFSTFITTTAPQIWDKYKVPIIIAGGVLLLSVLSPYVKLINKKAV